MCHVTQGDDVWLLLLLGKECLDAAAFSDVLVDNVLDLGRLVRRGSATVVRDVDFPSHIRSREGLQVNVTRKTGHYFYRDVDKFGQGFALVLFKQCPKIAVKKG